MSILSKLDQMFGAWSKGRAAQLAPSAQSADVTASSMAGLKNRENIPWLALAYHTNPNLVTGTEHNGNWLELKNALLDPKAASCLDIRCQVAPSLPWQIQPQEGTPPKAVDLVRRAFERLELLDLLEQMGRASFYGLTPIEVTWSLVKGELLPTALEAFDPWFMTFTAERIPLVMGRQLETGKLLLHRHGADWRNPWGLGRGRTIPRWVRVKNAVALATYRDFPNFSHDKIKFSYADGTDDIEQARYIQIAQDCINGPGMVVPDGMKTEAIRLESKFEMGAKLIEAANAEIATGILGNTLTTSEGQHGGIGSGAPAKAHEQTGNEQKSTDALRIQGTFNRELIPWIVALNLGPDVIPPKIVFDHEISTELKDLLEIVQGMKTLGLTASKKWARRVFGIPEPEDRQDALDPNPEQWQETPAVLSLPAAAKGVQLQDLPGSAMDPYALLDRWGQGYQDRLGATRSHARRALLEAQGYDQAMAQVLGTAPDFPTSAAEWLFSSLRAARALGAYGVGTELHLADADVDFTQTPDLALRWLQERVPTLAREVKNLSDQELRSRAFWVAGVDQMSLLQELQQGMVDALRTGMPYGEFRDLWAARLEAAGATGRMSIAFRANVDGAYGASRFAALQASPAVTNLTYVTAGDEKVRPEHRILDGVTRPKDDPFWSTHCPPLGFNCRCTLRAADAGARITPANDPRIDTPPSQGFGTGGRDFQGYLEGLGQLADATPEFQPATGDAYAWLDRLTPSVLARAKAAPTAPGTWPDLIQDPAGRVTSYLGEEARVAEALEDPSEIWLRPVASPEDRQALQLVYLQPYQDQFLVVRAQEGVVATKAAGLLTPDPAPFRRGVRIK